MRLSEDFGNILTYLTTDNDMKIYAFLYTLYIQTLILFLPKFAIVRLSHSLHLTNLALDLNTFLKVHKYGTRTFFKPQEIGLTGTTKSKCSSKG